MNNKTDINLIFEAYTVSRSLINEGHQYDAHFFETLDNVRMKVDTDDLDAIVDAMKAELGRNLTEAEIEHCEEYWTASEKDNESHADMQEVEAERRAQEEERRNEMAAEYIDPDDVDNVDYEDEEDEGNIFERLEAFMRSNPEVEQELTPILNDFQDIIEDINSLDADDYKVDATDLGIHLNRLFPDV
jgi:hypothetical protein